MKNRLTQFRNYLKSMKIAWLLKISAFMLEIKMINIGYKVLMYASKELDSWDNGEPAC